MKKTRKLIAPISLLLLLVMLFSSVGTPTIAAVETANYLGESPYINLMEGIDINEAEFFDSSVVQELPNGIGNDETISLIIRTKSETLLGAYNASGTKMSFAEFSATEEGERIKAEIKAEKEALIKRFDDANIIFDEGDEYSAVLSGFEITLKAKYYEDVCNAAGNDAKVILSDVYNVSETQYVENIVDVYETGIFNSKDFPVHGEGMLIAVLDTGLDYYHSAFNNFGISDKNDPSLGLTFAELEKLVGSTAAAGIQQGLTASDVFVSTKVPFAFDYADYDSDVYPLRSDHGTHVSGIIAGKDSPDKEDGITGVAPNAQLVEMKIFSDIMDTARSSWILSALEDCVILGVDVINLSIGTTCGFSTPSEKEQMSGVYDAIREAGISLVVAASNSFNSGYGSEKNGNLGLTSNPDQGTIGSPATYNGAFCVASVEGDKTAYLLHNGEIMYFNESSDKGGEEKNFVEELLSQQANGKKFVDMEFVTVPGVGRSADYKALGEDGVRGKIVLVRRGSTTFEEKAKVAEEKGAAGIIIYNNVSGDIIMNVGTVKIPACSVSKDDGERLAKVGKGTIRISLDQAAGPFISNFSSWGPSPDLELKPEITAHGGSIYSSVPGQEYDRISGTSMACPNIAGVVALLRQYLREKYPELSNIELTAMINRLLMSTANIIYNKNGLAYSPRKQGAGLANLKNAANTGAYIITYDREDGSVMDKSKIELGDDPDKTGVYKLVFTVDNFGDKTVSYDISTYVMTEGVSETKTDRGDTTVSGEGYLLEGCGITISSLEGGTLKGNNITVAAGEQATIEITVTLTDENKKYLDDSFENGMYVEGFVSLKSEDAETVDLTVPYLGFYGDWTRSPMFDIDYFETNKDEINDALDPEDKTLPDAYATRPIGGISSDYVGYLGAYYYEQKPGSKKIAADRKYISLSNQEDTINSLRFVWAGMLRGAERIEITVTEDSTGNVVYYTVDEYIRKSYSDGGVMIYPANIDIEFSAIEHNLKNNTAYTVTLKGYLDYGDGGADTNLNNTFTFPLVTDFSSPTVTDCEFYTEYDRSAKKNRLYAKVGIYDNHYAMASYIGYAGTVNQQLTFVGFDQYFTQVPSSFNSTTYMVYELTDYIEEIKKNADNKNSFAIAVYDYALNTSMYEIALPDEYTDMYFDTAELDDVANLTLGAAYAIGDIYPTVTIEEIERITSSSDMFTIDGTSITVNKPRGDGTSYKAGDVGQLTIEFKDGTTRTLYVYASTRSSDPVAVKSVVLSPNQTYKLNPLVYPETEWGELLEFTFTSNTRNVAGVVGRELLALSKGRGYVNAKDTSGRITRIPVLVLGESDDGYKKYTAPVTQSFDIAGYTTNKAYYFLNSEDRDIGKDGDERKFVNGNLSLSMYPSESVTLLPKYLPYFPSKTTIVFESSNTDIVTIDANGTVIAKAEGFASVSATLYVDGVSSRYYSKTVSIEVKDPYNANGPMLSNYYGLGGVVEIPEDLCLTDIGQFAFSNFDYIPKEPHEITEDEPDNTKIWFIGDDTITHITIPEGVERIGMYAFANLTALKSVTLPSTLKSISNGAFYGCTSLEIVRTRDEDGNILDGTINAKFINREAFANCKLEGTLNLDGAIAVSDYAFAGNAGITKLVLGEGTKSIASYAFADNTRLSKVTIKAEEKIKLGKYAFSNCAKITDIAINASVIPTGAFLGCTNLENVTIGKDVEVIGEFAFAGTKVASFTVDEGNATYKAVNGRPFLVSADGKSILLVAPAATELDASDMTGITSIGSGAFSGNTKLVSIKIPSVTEVGDYAFAACTSLAQIEFGKLTAVGDYAFYGTKIDILPEFDSSLNKIGSYAFAMTKISELTVQDGTQIGEYAFAECDNLEKIIIGDDVKIGDYAFYTNIFSIDNREISSVKIGDVTYYYYTYLSPIKTLVIGDNAVIGEGAFYGAAELESVTLGDGAYIGKFAFYHNDKLEKIDLSGVIYIGDWAFTGAYDTYYLGSDADGNLSGNAINSTKTDYLYVFYTPNLESIDLSSATYVGAEAFTYCGYTGEIDRGESGGLSTVKLGEGTKTLAAGAFASCTKLVSINLENVESIGDYALYDTAITSADISSATELGERAFAYSKKLISVKLGEGIDIIGNDAFLFCYELESVEGLENVRYIGDNAFAYTAITEAALTNAEYIGSYAFYKDTLTDFKLTLGEKLVDMGDNPFAQCKVAPLYKEETVDFGGNSHTLVSYNFTLGDNVKVIDGSLYLVVPAGLELISYFGEGKNVTVAEGTVRISASAFRGYTTLQNVILPSTLKAIGHKAFFGCTELSSVTFKSYYAPVLEEEYDPNYYLLNNVPYIVSQLDEEGKNIGLGIRDYFHLNITPSTFFYGANFKNYIGKIDNKITMIRPVNGQNYGSFTLSQYFDMEVIGEGAADDITIGAIDAISKIPDRVSLKDKATIEAARAAYNKISTNDQRALVLDFLDILEKAEKRIANLESSSQPQEPDTPVIPDTPDVPSAPDNTVSEENKGGVSAGIVVLVAVLALALGAAGGSALIIFTGKKRNSN